MAKDKPKDYSVFPQGNANRFKHSAEELFDLLDTREVAKLEKMGGIGEIVRRLETHPENGLPQDEIDSGFADRKTQYGVNYIKPIPPKGFFYLWIMALDDLTMIILLVSAIISLILGLIPALNEEDDMGWLDGTAILVAIVIVCTVTAVNDYSKELQFQKLNAQKVDRTVKVIRAGKPCEISVHEVVVGDLCVVQTGDAIPTDGLFVSGFNASVDESAMTGETDYIKKGEERPFLLSGTALVEGSLNMVATGVGTHSQWGLILNNLSEETGQTPLQKKLDQMAKLIGYVGIGAAILTFLGLVLRWGLDIAQDKKDGIEFDAKAFVDWVDFFIIAITIIVVAVPEGLPLAVTISLAFSMKRMMKDQNFVRKLQACETMGGCQAICSDKTGTLTLNQMTVVRVVTGETLYDVEHPDATPRKEDIHPFARDMLLVNSAVNSSANLLDRADDDRPFVSGSKTEGALLLLARAFGADYAAFRKQLDVVEEFSFSSARKRMSCVVDMAKSRFDGLSDVPMTTAAPEGSSGLRAFVKGASEIVFALCTHRMTDAGDVVPIDDEFRTLINEHIDTMAGHSLRTLVLAFRDLPPEFLEPVPGEESSEEFGFNRAELVEQDLIFTGLVGIMDPLRPTVRAAISSVQKAGITVRMITGDNIKTGTAIAKQCGIFKEDEGHIAIEGPAFRQMTDTDVDKIIPRIRVMARSSPSDKHRLVKRLKENHNKVVAVTGDGTNDAPALHVADVGLAMGIAGTEVAREASDIVILDDRFDSIVKAVEWGRTVMANIRKFLQFQLTVNVVALITAFVGAVSTGQSPLNAIQLLYVNLIMDSLGSLALATEGPMPGILDSQPVGKNEFLLTPKMIRNLVGQSVYQLIVVFVILYGGRAIFGVEDRAVPTDTWTASPEEYYQVYVNSLLYNAFIMCQIFNEFNCRRVKEKNIFQGLSKCPIFICVVVATLVIQVVLMLWCGSVIATVRITWGEWFITIAIGALSIPIGLLVKCIPAGDVLVLKRKTKAPAEEPALSEAVLSVQTESSMQVSLEGTD
eukprot:gnl/Chilomastix_cuspidata/37.p1 GENE.gnl/Chilomastix_cuspidata/37~~gnl/Chilomastix_cuspidata/37.p1  ORF type:complete len:1035 (-),score=582.19 gnl/Chilomastix_cuspidata/37:51-3155(-)